MPLLEKKQALCVAIEAALGTAETLVAGDGAMMVINPVITPAIDPDDRPSTNSWDGFAMSPGARRGRCTFEVEVTGEGSAGPNTPLWGAVLLPACGFVESSQVFTRTVSVPTGGADSSAVRTVTLELGKDGITELLRGAMGSVNFTFNSGQIIRAAFDFQGIYDSAVDDTLLAPTFPTVAPIRFGDTTTLTVGSTIDPSTMNINVANTIRIVEKPTDASGLGYAVIVGGEVNGRMNPQAGTTTSKARRDAYLARTEQALALSVGAATNQVQFAAPKLQYTGFEPENDGTLRDGLPFRCNRPITSAVDGALVITFA